MIYIGPKLSFDRMIRLLAHPLPLLSRQKVVSLSQSSCVSLTDVKGGKEVDEEQNHNTAKKPGPL
jgi:hypothetical protein